jgi:DNA-binding MarR family transcriptional regulator
VKHQVDLNKIEVEASRLNLEQPLGRFLIVLFRQFEDELISALNKSGHRSVTVSDFNVLRHVDPKGISSTRIANLAGITKQAIGKQIDKLEAEGLIRRESHPTDQRAKLIVFTKKGQRLIVDSIAIIQKIESRYARALGGGEQLDNIKASLDLLISP